MKNEKNYCAFVLNTAFFCCVGAVRNGGSIKEGKRFCGEPGSKETAYYVGMADTHTIEVKVDDQPVSFEFSDDFSDVLNKFSENDKVSITYFTNDKGQKEIKEIEKAK